MAYRLIDRNRQIPNGMFFYQPQTKWRSRQWCSFRGIVEGLISHRQANPWLGLSTDRKTVEDEVDAFNAKVCADMGWNDYITTGEGAPVSPFPKAPASQFPHSLLNPLRNVAAGAEANVEWIKSKEEAVERDLANHRAAICAKCPLNGKGDLTRYFVLPLAAAIRKVMELSRQWNLVTDYDSVLGVCEACSCPMRLKVHFPMKIIRNHLTENQKGALHPDCWIRHEP